MSLILKAISYKGSSPAQEISARFDEQGGSVGRSPDNHLVLPDPDKFISRLHARIIFQNGQYFIQDCSTGGTYLALKDLSLQQSQAPLENGECLRIGEYELSVSIVASAQTGFSPIVEPVRQLELAESGLLDSPFTAPKTPESSADFFSSFIDQPESSVFHESFTPPQVASAPQIPAGDDLDFGDLLSTLDSLPSTAGSNQKPDLPPLPDDFFAEVSIADDKPSRPETALDFDALFSDNQPQPDIQKVDDLFNQPAEANLPADNVAVAENPVHMADDEADIFAEPFTPTAPAMTVAEVKPVPEVTLVDSHKVQPRQPDVTVSDSELLRQFLAGAGINDANFLPAEQWPALMKTSGELLRSMVEGLMLVLRARAELKSQFRVSVTTMRPVNNNPLKFTPNADDAIKLILAPTNPGFLPPKEAVREGFSDIMNHQMAMTAGIQAALADILRGFDPQAIEKTQGEGVLFQKKAKCWEYYAEKYPQLKASSMEEFFGDAFAEAYEKQMLLLSRSSKSS
jgi:type VI secretion system FHA domain protein